MAFQIHHLSDYLASVLGAFFVLWKGVRAMQSFIPAIRIGLSVISLLIVLAEDALGPGTGDEKKAKVISDIKAELPNLATSLGIPSVIVGMLTNETVLGMVIDFLVGVANASGVLPKQDSTLAA